MALVVDCHWQYPCFTPRMTGTAEIGEKRTTTKGVVRFRDVLIGPPTSWVPT
jgi:hypothetical protein